MAHSTPFTAPGSTAPHADKRGGFMGRSLAHLGVVGRFVDLLGALVLIGFGTHGAVPHRLTGRMAQRMVAIVMAIVTVCVVIGFVAIVESHVQ